MESYKISYFMDKSGYDQNAERWSKRMRGQKSIAHKYLEKPAMYSKLPNLEGSSVLCLGCGSGEECVYLKERGAKRVVGTDTSKGLIEQAKYAYPGLEFLEMDMRHLSFEPESFDFVYSSLAIHYVQDWKSVFSAVHKILKRGGVFLFSTHHPIKWAAQADKKGASSSFTMGYTKREDQNDYEVYGDYLNERQITDVLAEGLKVTYYHKPLSSILSDIRDSGFEILDFAEPKAVPKAASERKDFYEIHQKIPLFMIFKLKKDLM